MSKARDDAAPSAVDTDVPTRTQRLEAEPLTADAAHTLPARPDAHAPRLGQEPTAYTEPRAVRAAGEDTGAFLDRAERYRTGELLGQGGMGSVRLFKDRRVGREVALKRMHTSAVPGGELWKRFVREARVQGQLEHPSIVPVYDLDLSFEGDPYFTMRRVQGDTLAQLLWRLHKGDALTRARWSQRKLLTAFVSVCNAVHYAHTKGVVHRDLKPGNIMLGAFGEVYVLDWGLARVLDEKEDPYGKPGSQVVTETSFDAALDGYVLTQAGTVLGTPMYMAPEQFRGDLIDARADVYALGMILYELFTLRPFHYRREHQELTAMVLQGIDARPSLAAPETPPEIDALCARATALEPEDRIPTALELAEEVERFLDGVRDTERRRELASQAAGRARETLRSAEREEDDAAQAHGRNEAMRQVLSALALDAEQPEARETMVRLLTEAPRTPPPAVREELEEARHAARKRGLELARWAWVSWLCTAPVVFLLGVRSLGAFLAECGLVALGTALCFVLARKPRVEASDLRLLALVTAAMLGGLSMWLGPFVLVPSATSGLLVFISSHSRPAERRPLFAIAAAVVLVPLLLEWAGLVPASYVFEPGRLCLPARGTELHPRSTVAMLVYSALGFVLIPSMLLGRLRDQLDAAQARLAMQSWQLRQLGRAGTE